MLNSSYIYLHESFKKFKSVFDIKQFPAIVPSCSFGWILKFVTIAKSCISKNQLMLWNWTVNILNAAPEIFHTNRKYTQNKSSLPAIYWRTYLVFQLIASRSFPFLSVLYLLRRLCMSYSVDIAFVFPFSKELKRFLKAFKTIIIRELWVSRWTSASTRDRERASRRGSGNMTLMHWT